MSIVWWAAGSISLLYFTGYVIWVGANNSFTFFWLLLGILLVVLGFVHQWMKNKNLNWYPYAAHIFYGVLLCVLAFFLVTLGVVIKDGVKKADRNADYLIVLGAHVYGERMSSNLKYRIELAKEYLEENPETKVIVSGGQGHGEKISEAEAMYRYLIKNGIAKERIQKEEASVNTEENIKNSIKTGALEKKTVIIVSNDFHVHRAVGIAKKLGLTGVQGLGSKTHPYTSVNCYTREVFAVIKYKVCGQI